MEQLTYTVLGIMATLIGCYGQAEYGGRFWWWIIGVGVFLWIGGFYG